MQTQIIRIFILLMIIFSSTILFGQQNDVKLWTGLDVGYELSRKTDLKLTLEQRFNNNITEFDRILIEPSVSYKLNKKWSINLKYRGWYKKSIQNKIDFRQRGKFSIIYKIKQKQLKIRLSSGVQYGIPDFGNDLAYSKNDIVIRNSIKSSYDIFGTKFSPFVKYELFTSAGNLKLMNYQWRIIGGLDYALSYYGSIRIFYAYEHEYNIIYPTNSYIPGVGFSYKI